MVDRNQSAAVISCGADTTDRKGSRKALSVAERIIVACLRGYKIGVSPFLPSACRFYPTCSQYMIQAVEKHGVFTGGWMGLRRLCRCHPFNDGGIDHVPELRN